MIRFQDSVALVVLFIILFGSLKQLCPLLYCTMASEHMLGA